MMHSPNSTHQEPARSQMASNILETFIPGFESISAFLSEALGLDVTAIVSGIFLLFGLFKAMNFLRREAMNTLVRFATCSVLLDSNADAYHWLVDFLQAKGVGKNCTDLIAVSNPSSFSNITIENGYEIDGEFVPFAKPSGGLDAPSKKLKIRYEPSLGINQWFWHKDHLFLWQRWIEKRTQGMGYGSPDLDDRIRGQLFCFAKTTAPIKSLMRDAIARYESSTSTKTVVRRPASSRQRRSGGATWVKVTTRPSRALSSIILAESKKRRIEADMRDFLSSKTRAWYADRGIPYRRGYLLNGPPGTGKTSLTFALAGVFDLDIYCISLAEASITEEDLAKLFDNLPEKCLVLLEDIDAAGLTFRGDLVTKQKQPEGGQQKVDKDDINILNFSEDTGLDQEKHNRNSGISQISLSGLLNVIDGVAASEGRLLFMTTNDITGLDGALMRPGRIDLKIKFALATQNDAIMLFKQIFRDREPVHDSVRLEDHKGLELEGSDMHIELENLSKCFAAKIPDGILGQAEIQGFLISYKNNPKEAVDQTDRWIQQRLRASDR